MHWYQELVVLNIWLCLLYFETFTSNFIALWSEKVVSMILIPFYWFRVSVRQSGESSFVKVPLCLERKHLIAGCGVQYMLMSSGLFVVLFIFFL